MQKQREVLFIGSFSLSKGGHYGGIYFASSSLRDKLIEKGIKVIELDTAIKDLSVTKVSSRFISLLARTFKFLCKILTSSNAKTLLVFISGGNSYLDKLPSILLARLLGKQIIVLPRSGYIMRDFDKKHYKFFILRVLSNASFIICQSSYWKNYFKSKNIDEAKLKIIENWVPDSRIIKGDKIDFISLENNSTKKFKMIFVSRIEIDKGILDLIEVAKLLSNKLQFKIDIYGDGSFRNDLLELIKKERLENFFCYKGWLKSNNMQEVVNKYDLALFTSRIEGYPNSLLDFVFSKIPILAYKIPQVEAVGGDNMFYYDDIQTFANSIIYCYNNYNDASLRSMRIYAEKKKQNNIEFAFNELFELFYQR